MTSLLRRGALAFVLVAGALALSIPAWSSSSSAASTSMETKMRAASQSASSAKPTSSTTIVIQNFAFSPASIKVKPGQKVKVINKDTVTHTLTSDSGKFNTGDISPGKTVTFTAPTKAGRYPYRCQIHQYMTGVLVVS